VTGDLTIRDVTKEIQFPAEIFHKDGKIFAKADLIINRKDFNVNYRSYMNPIGNDVKIHFDIQAE